MAKAKAALPVSRAEALAFVVATLGMLCLASLLLPVWLGPPPHVFEAHKPNIVILPNQPSALPAPTEGPPMVLLVGNSHTYALPGLHRGDELRPDVGVTLVDELANRVDPMIAPGTVRYYRLAYPNFVPLEIITRVGQMLAAGYKPTVFVYGWSWANLGRAENVRPQVRSTYEIPGFADQLIRMLSAPEVHADPAVIDAIRAQNRLAQADLSERQARPIADTFDDELSEVARSSIPLFSRSADVRTRFMRNVVIPIQDIRLREQENGGGRFLYDSIDIEREFNMKCLYALLRMLHSQGVFVYTYATPERGDLSPFMDPTHEDETLDAYRAEASRLGYVTVDARRVVVGADVWGWVGQAPDRSHFAEPGHRVLAEFIAQQGVQAGVWDRLRPAARVTNTGAGQ